MLSEGLGRKLRAAERGGLGREERPEPYWGPTDRREEQDQSQEERGRGGAVEQ